MLTKRHQIALCAAWTVAVGIGIVVALDYERTSGAAIVPKTQWPTGTSVRLETDRSTLLLFAHPRCPCTRASLEELNRVLARGGSRVATRVFFLKPSEQAEDWFRTPLWESVAAMPAVTVHADTDGVEARAFGVQTSGSVLLYDRHGKLQFQGGITAGRGHVGPNAGEASLLGLISGATQESASAPVYGCALFHCPPPSEAETP